MGPMQDKKLYVVVCEDDPLYHKTLQLGLQDRFELKFCTHPAHLMAQLRARRADAVLLDLHLQRCDEGFDLLSSLSTSHPQVPIIVHSGVADYPRVVRALQLGATHYVPKGVSLQRLAAVVQDAAAAAQLKMAKPHSPRPTAAVRSAAKNAAAIPMVGDSAPLRALQAQVARLQRYCGNVLIYGETGSGKELVARALQVPEQPFVAVDCATLATATAESTLFGHARGAFTGAETSRRGLLEEASGGILYFDEVANMSLEVQAKLLRALQEKEIVPLGTHRPRPVHFRVLAATHHCLQTQCQRGLFRRDLFARLQVFELQVPPLRQRRDDIPLLLNYFLPRAWEQAGADPQACPQITPAALSLLCTYSWPLNIRELSHVVYAMVACCDGGPIEPQHLPPRLLAAGPTSLEPQCHNDMAPSAAVQGNTTAAAAAASAAQNAAFLSTVPPAATPAAVPAPQSAPVFAPSHRPASYAARRRAFERQELQHAYQQAAGNVAQMARDLQMDRSTLHHKLTAYAIHLPRQDRFRAQRPGVAGVDDLAAAKGVFATTGSSTPASAVAVSQQEARVLGHK
jgi:DNA-binding NtrC family response regulator